MHVEDIPEAVRLQRLCFPAPFPENLLWSAEHLHRHQELFSAGQFVATVGGSVVGSASATRISEEVWQAHANWNDTVGGPFLETFDPNGSTIYGLDISVHPEYRNRGIARLLYELRKDLARSVGAIRFGTACRLPGYGINRLFHPDSTPESYAERTAKGAISDPTMTPLLRNGLEYIRVIRNYMEDEESGNAAALLEWKA